jgi:hypothetical protein
MWPHARGNRRLGQPGRRAAEGDHGGIAGPAGGNGKSIMMGENLDWARLIYLLMALLLVAGGGWGVQRYRLDGRNALIGVFFWAALIVAIVLAYNAFN